MTVLEVLLVLVASSALINYVMTHYYSTQHIMDAANAQKFHAFYDPGKKSMDKGDYAAALKNFSQSEQSLVPLTDTQYGQLKNSRLQIAAACESSGDKSEAQDAYLSLFNSGLQQGSLLLKSHHPDDALARFIDAQSFSSHLTDGSGPYAIQSGEGIADSLRELHRYPDAIDAAQNVIDYARANADPYDAAFTSEYLEMSRIYSEQNDWPNSERALLLAWGEIDKRIDHLSSLPSADNSLPDALVGKDDILYNLIVAYQHEGKTDSALNTSEALFNFVSRNFQHFDERPYSRREIATLALQVATQANRQDAASLWRDRQAHWF